MLKLLRRFRWIDWLLLVLIMGLTVLQVWATMSMVDAMSDLIKSIGYVNAHNSMGITDPAMWEAIALDPELAPIANASTKDIWVEAGKVVLIALGIIGAQAAISISAAAISANFAVSLRHDMSEHISRFSMGEINRFSTASLITRTTNDVERVQMTILWGMRAFFSAPTTAIWAICKLQATSFQLTLVEIVALSFMVVVLTVIMILIVPKFKLFQKTLDRINLVTRENLAGVRVVRAYNAEDYQESKFNEANENLRKLNTFASRINALLNPLLILIMDGVSLSMYWIGSRLINAGETDYASVVGFMMLATQIIMSFLMLLFLMIMFPRAMVSAKRINEVLDTKPSIVDPEEPKVGDGSGDIVFDHVNFLYPDASSPALEDISFSVKGGETLAIIGGTGCGKSTLVQLIDRLYDVSEGSVKVGGVDVREYAQETLRQGIGYVPQKGQLFSGTIRENVSLGLEENLDDARMKEVAEVSCSEEFIQEKEGGYEAQITQGGTNVSGGQRQRLCIARAAAMKPSIYVFDDAFSALDFKTDLAVRTNLKAYSSGATKVIVAQRIGTIMDADQILVLDSGKIVGKGKHEDLLRNCEIYRQIALSQLSKEELGL